MNENFRWLVLVLAGANERELGQLRTACAEANHCVAGKLLAKLLERYMTGGR